MQDLVGAEWPFGGVVSLLLWEQFQSCNRTFRVELIVYTVKPISRTLQNDRTIGERSEITNYLTHVTTRRPLRPPANLPIPVRSENGAGLSTLEFLIIDFNTIDFDTNPTPAIPEQGLHHSPQQKYNLLLMHNSQQVPSLHD